MANEWVVKVTADVKGVLDASRQIGQAGKQAGEQFKQGFGGSDQTIEGLRSRLNELTQSLNKAAIGSKEFAAAQKEIAKTQQEINNALKGVAAGEATINGLRNKMAALNETLGQSVIGSKEFVAAQKEIAQTQDKLNAAIKGFGGNQNSIEGLNNRLAEYNSILQKAEIGSKDFVAAQRGIAATQKQVNDALKGFSASENTINGLRSKISALNETLGQSVVGSKEFVATQKEITQTQERLNAALKGFSGNQNSIEGLNNKLTELNGVLQKAEISSKEFVAAQKEIAQTQDRLNAALKGFTGSQNSIEGLNNKLAQYNSALQKAEIGSREFVAAQKGIAATQREINNALNGFSGKEQTISGLRNRLSELNQSLDKTAIGSLAFKETQSEIARTQLQVDQALGKTSVAVGVLGNALNALGFVGVTYSVVGFLKGSIQGAAELETTTRKLSATLGAQGAAGALSFARETAETLGLSYRSLSSTFGSFTAAATASGVPLKQQKELFASVAKAGQVLGLTNDGISGTFLALQQIASKGVVSMEELRQQLGEQLPTALAATAKGLGISQQSLIKLVESGKLTSAKFFPALTKGLNELTAGAGGVPTAAQNFAKLQNAWEDLQASFGTSLLPTVTQQVVKLVGALEGLKVDVSARDLRQSFGVTADEATQLVGILKNITKEYGLSDQQAKNLLSNAIANTGASRDWFGELNLGGNRFAQVQTEIGDLAKDFASKQRDIVGETNAAVAAESQRLTIAKKQNEEKVKELASQAQLAEAVGRTLQAENAGRAEVQQAGINLGQALIGLENSRFSIIRNRNNYELQEAQKRGASEQELDAIRRQADAIDKAALDFKYKALLEQQNLQRSLLALQQEGAALEADLASNNARLEVDKARLKLQSAELAGNKEAIAQAELGVQIAELGVQSADSKLQILAKTQPIEAQIAAANGEAAQNQLKAEAASKGLALAADGTFKAAKNTADQFKTYGNSLKVPLSQQGSFAELAKAVGLQVRDTGKGYFEIGKTLGKDASPAANNIRDYMGTAAKATGAARTQAAGLATNMNNAAGAAQSFYNALAAASGLPDARFTGGPVDAGRTYRINDGPSGMSLGQESFLSASGALSLINRPANSLWMAPSKGTVIPAAVTSRLKESGALGGGAGVMRVGSDPAMAHLAAAVGNLSQEVAELRRKAWNVGVNVRGDGSSLKLQQTMARIR
jgi:tape measure domain-containing protein